MPSSERASERSHDPATVLVGVIGGSADEVRMGTDFVNGLAYGHYSQKDEYRADCRRRTLHGKSRI